MGEASTEHSQLLRSTERRGLLAGALIASLTAFVLVAMLVVFVGARIGFGTLATAFVRQPVLDLPDDVLDELIRLHAVVGKANNPTKARKHDTILVRPHPELGYQLRPNARIAAHLLRAENPLNLDPPTVYLPAGSRLSPQLTQFLQREQRVEFHYSTDATGRRITLPRVESNRKILVVGDSVAFGVRVTDDSTMASFLQQMLQETHQIINAGVGGYTAEQAISTADALSQDTGFEALIYLTSQNDFMDDKGDFVEQARSTLHDLATLKPRFPDGIAVAVFPYMEYSIRDVLMDYGWPRLRLDQSERLFESLPRVARDAGVEYLDLAQLLAADTSHTGSIFSRFAYYADHGHMSPMANSVVAEKLISLLDLTQERTN